MAFGSLSREFAVACTLARQAGTIALRHLDSGLQVRHKGDDPTNLVTQADVEANNLIVAGLAAAFPGDAILAEESAPDRARQSAARLWCVDPIDGTHDYVAKTGQFVVMIGLAIERAATLGVVYAPTLNKLWYGAHGRAVVEDATGSRPLRVSSCQDARCATLVASRRHVCRQVAQMAGTMGICRRLALGSVGLKAACVAEGQAEIYVSLSSRTHEWDICAPEAIVVAAGGTVTDACGAALCYNKTQTHTPRGIVASNGALHSACLAALRSAVSRRGWV